MIKQATSKKSQDEETELERRRRVSETLKASRDTRGSTPEVHDPGATMATSETGGHKQAKLARFGLIPPGPLRELAELYGKGAEYYDDHNYLKGYNWSLTYDALQRHLNAFWDGEDLDPEAQTKHVINAAWHCLALAEFMNHPERYSQYDDRISTKHPQDQD